MKRHFEGFKTLRKKINFFATSFVIVENLAETFQKLLTLIRLKKGTNPQIEANELTET